LKRLPAGYQRGGDGSVVIAANTRVREAIELIFRKFRELRTIRQAFQWFRDHDVELPVNPARGGNHLVWQIPTQAFVRAHWRYAPPGEPFICFEPMTAPTNALVTGAGVAAVRPGDRFSARFSITASET